MGKTKIALGVSLAFVSQAVWAETSEENMIKVDTVIVKGEGYAAKSEGNVWNQDRITATPKGNGTINDLLRTSHSVQFSNTEGTADSAGEIAPPNISFHGEKFYNNRFSIDGVSNDSNLNPAHNGSNTQLDADTINTHTVGELPAGHPQAFWISPSLVENIKVKDSNISAKYGRFTGGVVDADLIKANKDKAFGSLSYRTTRHTWTHHYIDPLYADEYRAGQSSNTQPKFTKHESNLALNQPVGKDSAVLFSYSRQRSSIPFLHQHLGQLTKQRRLAETFLLRGAHRINDDNNLSATVMYSPHYATYHPANYKDGRFTNSGGGWRFDLDWERYAGFGRMQSKLSYRSTEEKTAYDQDNLYRYNDDTPSINWTTHPEVDEAAVGGIGTSRSFGKHVNLQQHFEFNEADWGGWKHSFNAGWEAEYAEKGFERKKPTIIYGGPRMTDRTDCTECISGEQFFTGYAYNYPANIKVGTHNLALYFEDDIEKGNLRLKPGIRLDYNGFLKNTDIAPRFAFDYRLPLEPTKFHVFGGANRYYGSEMLTYKLRSAHLFQRNFDRFELDDPWTSRELREPRYDSSDLKTPYSNEWNLGVRQHIGNSEWQLKWVRRSSRNQFLTKEKTDENGLTYRVLTNTGRSDNDTFSFSAGLNEPWKLGPTLFRWRAGADYNKRRSNQIGTFQNYDWREWDVKKVLVDGKLKDPYDLPAMDFNQPWNAFVETELAVPKWHLTWTQRWRYSPGTVEYMRENIRCTPERAQLCQGYVGNLSKFDQIKYNSALIADWHFSWEKPLAKTQKLELNLDVLNVFNRKIVGKKVYTPEWQEKKRDLSYKTGRHFWLGAKYSW
ncbi:TonB-dependent receptor plug domain-containing protein [Neisseria wadsworthii]|uniref:TonB-dependent receptor plug domain-containing protein n=1 Tax=Neisseria wadsworthii TaxID=607711 RepID=UPI000D311C65|nr:TonB-dependent receptor plug domain-containing protein [Neisseria wadsworthii]